MTKCCKESSFFSWIAITGKKCTISQVLQPVLLVQVFSPYCQWKSIALWGSERMDIDFCLPFYLYLCLYVSVLCIAICDGAHTDFRGDNVPRIAQPVCLVKWCGGCVQSASVHCYAGHTHFILFPSTLLSWHSLFFIGARLEWSCSLFRCEFMI